MINKNDKKIYIINDDQPYLYCEKILHSYIHCIHHFSIKEKDCMHIYNIFYQLELCKKHNNVFDQLSQR
jgi:hypothetical protein